MMFSKTGSHKKDVNMDLEFEKMEREKKYQSNIK